jgi:D-amino-acid oxidase
MKCRTMKRRKVLGYGAALVTSAAVPGCASVTPAGTRISLPPVKVSEDRIMRQVVGLRPYRRNGFRLESETPGDKILIHNYGHGGGGGSLSWGCSQLAVEKLQESGRDSGDVAVLGAGYSGLTSARLLQDSGYKVTIYAADIPPGLTSNVAGAVWSPGHSVVSPEEVTPEFIELFTRAADISLQYFQGFLGQPGYGVRFIDAYQLSDRSPGPVEPNILIDHGQYDAHEIPTAENPAGMLWGRKFRALHIQSTMFLNRVVRDFRTHGGNIVIRKFVDTQSIMELGESAIINCTGLGSHALFNDQNLVPIKGQLIAMLPQPEIDYALFHSGGYMIPRDDGIMLGGSHDEGNWSLEPEQLVIDQIMTASAEMFARLD